MPSPQQPERQPVSVNFNELLKLNPNLQKPQQPAGATFGCPYCKATVSHEAPFCPACSRLLDTVHKAGEMIHGHYRILELMVQHGGFGRVYDVVDTRTSMSYSLKQLRADAGLRPKDVEHFKREGMILSMIKHPRVPRFHDSFTENGSHYLVMELIEGNPLSMHQRDVGPMTEAEVLEFLPQVLDTLEYLHGLNPPIIHRDLKPANLMKTLDGRVYLVDFGSATTYNTTATGGRGLEGPERDRTRIWTKGIAAPEMLLGEVTYPATDLFSLGLTLIYLMTNSHPLGLYEARKGQYIFSDKVCSPAFKAILQKMVALTVQERYPSAAEVREALRAAGLITVA
ncbi:Serine/threonine-protein kinase F [compost metagenome]